MATALERVDTIVQTLINNSVPKGTLEEVITVVTKAYKDRLPSTAEGVQKVPTDLSMEEKAAFFLECMFNIIQNFIQADAEREVRLETKDFIDAQVKTAKDLATEMLASIVVN